MPCLQVVLGTKLAYVTDAIYHEHNMALAKSADMLFIEAVFAHELARGQEKYHLTAAQAGWLAHRAGAKLVVPFHHSPIYHGKEALLQQELQEHFERGIVPSSA